MSICALRRMLNVPNALNLARAGFSGVRPMVQRSGLGESPGRMPMLRHPGRLLVGLPSRSSSIAPSMAHGAVRGLPGTVSSSVAVSRCSTPSTRLSLLVMVQANVVGA